MQHARRPVHDAMGAWVGRCHTYAVLEAHVGVELNELLRQSHRRTACRHMKRRSGPQFSHLQSVAV